MTPEAQKAAIAEACGIKEYPDFGLRDSHMVQVASCWNEWDPLNDLNVMAEVENVMDENQRIIYSNELYDLSVEHQIKTGKWRYLSATAAQRAEAFLRVIGKWDANVS